MRDTFSPSPRAPLARVWFITVTIGLAVATGCDRGGPAGAAGGFQRPPTPVEVAEVVEQQVVDRFDAVGTVQAADAITVVSEIPGIVRALPFREGDHVDRGAVLAELDDAELRAAFQRAEAIRDQRQAAFDRILVVVERGAGTPQDLDDAAADLKIAEADVALSRARLAKARITAPFAGRVGARAVSPGAFIQPGTRITELAAIDEIKVVFTAPERIVPRLIRGAGVQISTTAFPGVRLDGAIDVVAPILDAETRSVEVIARAKNPDEKFRPGMSADVAVVLDQRDNAMTIPSEAIFAEGEQTLVYVIQPDSTVARTPVSLGMRLPGSVEILTGLEPGQRIVRAGHQKLFPGARVMPVPSGPPGSEGPPASTGPPGATGETPGDTGENAEQPTS